MHIRWGGPFSILSMQSSVGMVLPGSAPRISTSIRCAVETYLDKPYPGAAMSRFPFQGKPTPEAIAYLSTADGTIHYTAAILRMWADLGTSKTEPRIGRLTDTAMAIIYGAYRSGGRSYGSLDDYQAASVPGSMGQIFLEFLHQCREYRRK